VHSCVHLIALKYAGVGRPTTHGEHTLSTIVRLPSGNWRVQLRRKGRYFSETFRQRKDALDWAYDNERRIDRGETARPSNQIDPTTFGHLIDLHIADMKDVGRCGQRSKAYTLEFLQKKLGCVRIADLSRERLVDFGRERARQGADPFTVGADIGYIKMIISHAAAVHGIAVSAEPVDLARIALKRLGLVGKGRSRDRRPTREELDRIFSLLEHSPKLTMPVARIARFAIATAMRQDEIARLRWSDVDSVTKTVIIRDRKDPRAKNGNHQKIPLLNATGFDAWELLREQAKLTKNMDRVFPYNGRSVGTAFRRACRDLKIEDLHFHDLRHEAASRLFEAGFSIEQVALVTGHRDWKMLKRYTHLRPEDLHHVVRPTWAARRGQT